MPGSPADKSGIQVGDVITQIDSQKIEDAGDVVDYVSGQKVGSKLTLAFVRDGKPGKAQITLAELPSNPYAANEPQLKKERIGMALQTLTPDMANAFGLGPDTKGAVVTDVEQGSIAAKAGLRPEDLIVEVDRKAVAGADEAVAALHAGGKTHLLKVRRGENYLFLTVPVP